MTLLHDNSCNPNCSSTLSQLQMELQLLIGGTTMGMFDTIKFDEPCPYCGHTGNWFQSKDGPCEMLNLEPYEVEEFYTSCRGCKSWLVYSVVAEVTREVTVHRLEITFDETYSRKREAPE
jgi:hypothetical protein